ncbi:MAG: hypothetical protein QXJ51_00400 [Sulfolobales archaeon]
MPIEVKDLNKFIEIASRAIECRVVRGGEKRSSKIKARTRRYLYTYVVKEEDLEGLISKLKEVCKNLVEIGS